MTQTREEDATDGSFGHCRFGIRACFGFRVSDFEFLQSERPTHPEAPRVPMNVVHVITRLILGGAQLLTLGLIGEYLSRVFDEVKRRPVYLLTQDPSGS